MPQDDLEAALIDPLTGSTWDDLLATHSDSTIFHSSAWARVLAQTYGHRPFYLHFTRGDASMALLPLMEVSSRLTGRRGVCLPFSDFCAPLLFNGATDAALINTMRNVAAEQGWRYFELRASLRSAADRPPVAQYFSHALNLERSGDELFAGLSSSARRAIRRAERSGVSTRVSSDGEAMTRFYQLHVRTRRRHGLPPQPFSFFRNIQESILAPGAGFIMEARYGSRTIAAAMFFHFGKNGLFKFGASDDRFQSLRANNLVMWTAISRLHAKEVKQLHFGRTDLDHDGLRRFKLSFGAQEGKIEYFRLPTSEATSSPTRRRASRLPTAIFRRLPLTINRIAGGLIYPHLH